MHPVAHSNDNHLHPGRNIQVTQRSFIHDFVKGPKNLPVADLSRKPVPHVEVHESFHPERPRAASQKELSKAQKPMSLGLET